MSDEQTKGQSRYLDSTLTVAWKKGTSLFWKWMLASRIALFQGFQGFVATRPPRVETHFVRSWGCPYKQRKKGSVVEFQVRNRSEQSLSFYNEIEDSEIELTCGIENQVDKTYLRRLIAFTASLAPFRDQCAVPRSMKDHLARPLLRATALLVQV